MPNPSAPSDNSPQSSTQPRSGRRPSTLFSQAREPSKRLRRESNGPDQRTRISPDVQIVLVTEGGLELPLVESPGQTARLLEYVAAMAAGIEVNGPLRDRIVADQRPYAVPMHRVLQRVRIVVRRDTSTEGDAA